MPLALSSYQIQIASISAFLKTKGHAVRYEECVIQDACLSEEHFSKIHTVVAEFKPDIIGFSGYELSFEWIKEIADDLKHNYPRVPIIVGGYYATLAPADVLSHPSIDYVCIGEGEYAMAELLDILQQGAVPHGVKNIWYKENNEIRRNSLRDLITPLDVLPFPDRDILISVEKKHGRLEIMASRGCPFDCANCANHALKQIYRGKGAYLRHRSVEHVLREIEAELAKDDYTNIQFHDDMFTANQTWLKEFCEKYKMRVKVPFICNIRPEACSVKTLAMLKDAGCAQVAIGVEAGDEKVRRKVLGRDMRDEVIIAAFKNARMVGIKTYSFNMVGLPDETMSSLWKTICLNFRLAPDAIQTSVYYPFKGTVLGDACYRNGWVDAARKKKIKLYANDSILNLPSVPRWAIKYAKWMNSAMVIRSGDFSSIMHGVKVLVHNFLISKLPVRQK